MLPNVSSSYGNQSTEPGFVIVPGEEKKGLGLRTDVCPCPSAAQLSHPPQFLVFMQSFPCRLRLHRPSLFGKRLFLRLCLSGAPLDTADGELGGKAGY